MNSCPPPVVHSAQVLTRIASHGPPGNIPLRRSTRLREKHVTTLIRSLKPNHECIKAPDEAHSSGTVVSTPPDLGAQATNATVKALFPAPATAVSNQNINVTANLTNNQMTDLTNAIANLANTVAKTTRFIAKLSANMNNDVHKINLYDSLVNLHVSVAKLHVGLNTDDANFIYHCTKWKNNVATMKNTFDNWRSNVNNGFGANVKETTRLNTKSQKSDIFQKRRRLG